MPLPLPPPTGFLDDLKAFEPVISWVLIIGGWLFARNDNNKRENRHELRGTIDAITVDIHALEQKAHGYYTTDVDPNTPSLQVEIKRDQDALAARIVQLRTKSYYQDIPKISAFQTALTGGDFEQANRQKRPASDRKMMEISLAAKELSDELEAEYRKMYKK